MDSKELKMSVSESDKMEVSVLGRRFSTKAEYLPIKKRRFLFSTSSPPLNTAFSEGPERDAACYNSSSQVVQPKVDASCQAAEASAVADLCQSGNIDNKMDGEKLVESSKKGADPCEVSGIVSNVTESLEALRTVKVEANCVNPVNMSTEETDLHIATTPSKDVASSTLDCSSLNKSTVENSCSHSPSESEYSRINQVTNKTQKSAAWDDRLNWDLNTVMVAWEEPLERCEQKREDRSASQNKDSENFQVDLKSLAHTVEGSEQEERKPGCNAIGKLLSPVICSTTHVAVNKMNSPVDSSIDAIPMAVPGTIKLEYQECDVSTKHANVPMAAGTDLSLDYSTPLGFDPCINMHSSEENIVSSTIVGSGNNVKHAITTLQTTECEKLNLSLVTAASPENGVHQSRSTFEVKKEITSNGITMENLIGKGSESSEEALKDSKEINQTTFGSFLVIQSSVLAEGEDHPAVSSISDVCSDAEVPIKAEKSPLTTTSGITQLNETIYHTSHEPDTDKEVSEVPLDNGFSYENFPSEVDNVDEFSVGYDSQFEDGELRELSIQTWEGNEGEDMENENGIDNRRTRFHLGTLGRHNNGSQCLPESSSRIKSPEVGSQKGADEISSVLLPEKLDTSDQVSENGPNETKNGTREVSMKDESQSDQWKMNVSGLDFLPENHSPTSNATNKMRDFSSIKFSSRIGRYGPETEDLETKAEGSRFYRREPLSRIGEPPSTRDPFLNRGRFKMQGCSSINADDSASRSIRESGVMRSLRRGKYSPQVPASGRGVGPWNCSQGRERDLNHLHSPPYPGPFHRSLLQDDLTNEIGIDPNDDVRPVASSYITRQSFRNRLLANRDEDDFRARLGLRPSGDTCHNRFGNVGPGRSPRYGSRHNGGGPRGQYYAPATDEYDEPSMEEYSHSFPRRRQCFPPIERKENENNPCTHHHSGSTSPPRSRTRSPMRSDTRIRRPRSPNYRHGFEADHVVGYNLDPRNNTSPPNSRWVKYKQRRSPPPPGRIDPPIGERLNFYDPSRKTKQIDNYRSGHSGRFSGRGGTRFLGNDGDLTDHGHRRGGFVRRYDMGRPVKHFQYDEQDGYGPVYDSRDKEALELHGRGNPKQQPFSRRPREERENW